GEAHMVDVSAKAETVREARAEAFVTMRSETLAMIVDGKHHKGAENPRWKQLNYKYLHKKELRMKWVEDHRSIFLALQKRDAEQA
ncbi:hypothetical protein MJL48_31565, partial [Salmonella enterica subsp. enterica serovar Kentucky]|nr:hypothetical protein [Salmonella enterica subsp. enterica serovar Kentucky]